jgi:hypothetical protein
MACAARHLRDSDETSRLMVARKIIEIAKAGELNPDRLCERAVPTANPNQLTDGSKSVDSSLDEGLSLPKIISRMTNWRRCMCSPPEDHTLHTPTTSYRQSRTANRLITYG